MDTFLQENLVDIINQKCLLFFNIHVLIKLLGGKGSIFLDKTWLCTHQLRAAVVTCTRLSSRNSSMDREESPEATLHQSSYWWWLTAAEGDRVTLLWGCTLVAHALVDGHTPYLYGQY